MNHGTSWGSSPPEPGLGVFSLLATEDEVFAGSEGSGAPVYRSTNHGASWDPMGDGLPGGQGIEALGAAGAFLFAATDEMGVWVHSNAAAVNPGPAPGSALALSIVGPNPAHDGTVIEVRLPEAAPIEVRLFDVTGRTLRRLASGEQSAGVHRFEWHADGLPAGVYYFQLETEGAERTAKILLIR